MCATASARSPHLDSLEDCIAYAALKAEARLAEDPRKDGAA